MKSIISIIGARPQFIKHAPLKRVLNEEFNNITVHTGQHYDNNMSDIFFDELEIDKPEYNLNVGSDTQAKQTGKMMIGLEEVFEMERPDMIIIYGDTNSTLAAALTASKMHIPIAHIEAGMRSFNRYMPEEINRIIADRLSQLNFAPSYTAMENLKNEGLNGIFSGDIMYDAFIMFSKKVESIDISNYLNLINDDFILLTLHRQFNTIEENLIKILNNLSKSKYKFLFPVHPRTKNIIIKNNIRFDNIIMIEPVGYLELLKLLKTCKAVCTDSGGLQKESYFAQKKCITIRKETEWVETLRDNANTLCFMGECNIDSLIESSNFTFKNYYGNGYAAQTILENIQEFL